jgi:F-type H+-transporting ATPase subunit gamma
MSLRDIKRKITSVEKTQQITRAMKLVAAAKLRRAQEAIESARPYAQQMNEMLAGIASQAGDASHPLLETREERKNLEVVVITSDRGLAGAFNSNVLKAAEELVATRGGDYEKVSLTCVGRKAVEFFTKRRPTQVGRSIQGIAVVQYSEAEALATEIGKRYADGESDEVIVVFNEFVSIMTQIVVEKQLLPFASPQVEEGEEAPLPYEVEPSAEAVLATLVPKALTTEIFRALLENQSGEHAARMTAMESATQNSTEVIDSLTLKYNRARQASITAELIEIITGAQAL